MFAAEYLRLVRQSFADVLMRLKLDGAPHLQGDIFILAENWLPLTGK